MAPSPQTYYVSPLDATSLIGLGALPLPPEPRRTAQSLPQGLGRQQTRSYVLGRVKDAGFDPAVIDRVIMCESGYNNLATHKNKNDTLDVGLWQINDVHGLSVADRIDVVKSTDFAISLLRSKRSVHHWMCYK